MRGSRLATCSRPTRHSPAALCHCRVVAPLRAPPDHGRRRSRARAVVDRARRQPRSLFRQHRRQPARSTAPTLVPPVLTSTVFRRVLRPGGRLMRVAAVHRDRDADESHRRINAGEVTSAPPKTVPAGVATVDQAVSAVMPHWRAGGHARLAQQISVAALGGAGYRDRARDHSVLGARPASQVRRRARNRRGAASIYSACFAAGRPTQQASQAVSQAGQTAASVASYPDQQQLRR